MCETETAADVLRMDAEATPGPWDEDGIYMGLRHLCKHCSDWYYRNPDGDLIPVPRDNDAALIAYYRTAAPALALEVQRLQAECIDLHSALDLSCEREARAHLRGQEAMRERCAARVDRAANEACACDGTLCGPDDVATHDADCLAFDLDDLAQAIRALEVTHD